MHRRTALRSLAVAATSLAVGPSRIVRADRPPSLRIAPFRFDVTPPEGHGCCGGWIKPVVAVDDGLEAIGFVLLGAGQPIVVCAVDWTGILNSAHVAWRTALAEAAGTTADRVAVQCVHQHNAPFACLDTQTLLDEQGDLPATLDRRYFADCLERGKKAITAALPDARPVTHVAHGQARVREVASNRRFLGADGKIEYWRGSATKDVTLQALPEGLIDPWLKTAAFYEGDRKLVSCHYFASHPMSYYGDGRVTSDFVGLARKKRQTDEPDTTHIYFTGCAGNVAAGKYNDGTPAARVRLTERMYAGIVESERDLERRPIRQASWSTAPVLLAPNPAFDPRKLSEQIKNQSTAVAGRSRPAFTLAFMRRCERRIPIVLSALHVDDVTLLHLPAESFVEYQLRAQAAAPQRFVATAAYGDGGPWYIPVKEAYAQGGYESSVAFSSDASDERLTGGAGQLVS